LNLTYHISNLKKRKIIKERLARRKHRKELNRKKLKLNRKKTFIKAHDLYKNIADIKYDNLSDNLKFISECQKTEILEPDYMNKEGFKNEKTILVPDIFSLVERPNETFDFIKNVINTIYHNKVKWLYFDYKKCTDIHIGAQVLLDILLRDIFQYSRKLSLKHPHLSLLTKVQYINANNENILKLLHSVGSLAIMGNQKIEFPDIIPYHLCEFKNSPSTDILVKIERKEKDVTKMVDYIVDSLKRMGKELNPSSIDDLSIIIGEILINAEEHSSIKHRFSIGYFQEFLKGDDKFGIFNLAILNFGETIYDKFKSPKCGRPDIVEEMTDLSNQYKNRKLFNKNLGEETLWTLYALQEEVTSVSIAKNRKRGNGSIRFIESFFNIKGQRRESDKISRLALLSGNASIVFDGKYGILKKQKNGDKFSVMTFNKSGNISDKPDTKYVKFVPNYFPGTIITAQILINRDDIL
jgi:hypothetical protein